MEKLRYQLCIKETPIPIQQKLIQKIRTTQVRHEVEDESLFKKLDFLPDMETMDKSCKTFVLNNLTPNDQVLNLYSLAKDTFVKKWDPHNSTNWIKAPEIEEIRYHENDKLSQKYNDCKAAFRATGIPLTEKLVFHGTADVPISIFSKGFDLKRVKRVAKGKGLHLEKLN